MSVIAVFTTIDSEAQARKIAAALVERRLAACVQVSEIESFYTWDDATQNDREFRLMIKTTDTRYSDVEAAIRELHSYDLPAIYALDIDSVYAPYADWVARNSTD